MYQENENLELFLAKRKTNHQVYENEYVHILVENTYANMSKDINDNNQDDEEDLNALLSFNNNLTEELYEKRNHTFVGTTDYQQMSEVKLNSNEKSIKRYGIKLNDIQNLISSLEHLKLPALIDTLIQIQNLSYNNPTMKIFFKQCDGIRQLAKLILNPNAYLRKYSSSILRNLSYESTQEILQYIIETECFQNALDLLLIIDHENNNQYSIKDITAIKDATTIKNFRNININVQENILSMICNYSIYDVHKSRIIKDALPILIELIAYRTLGLEKQLTGNLAQGETLVQVNQCSNIHASNTCNILAKIIKNVSFVTEPKLRHVLRYTSGLIETLLILLKNGVLNNTLSEKLFVNTADSLRNLSFGCQEIEDPIYLIRRAEQFQKAAMSLKESRKARKGKVIDYTKEFPSYNDKKIKSGYLLKQYQLQMGFKKNKSFSKNLESPSDLHIKPFFKPTGAQLLYHPSVLQLYFRVLINESSSNEVKCAVLGIIQNLVACDWQPSIVRLIGGLSIIFQILKSEPYDDNVWRVLCSTLRNLTLDPINRDEIAIKGIPLLLKPLEEAKLYRDNRPNSPIYKKIQDSPIHSSTQGLRYYAQGLDVNYEELTMPSKFFFQNQTKIELSTKTENIFSFKAYSAIISTLYALVKDESKYAKIFLDNFGVEKMNTFLTYKPSSIIRKNYYFSLMNDQEKTRRFAQFILRHIWKMRDLHPLFQERGLYSEHFGPHKPIVHLSKELNKSLKNTISNGQQALVPMALKLQKYSKKILKKNEQMLPSIPARRGDSSHSRLNIPLSVLYKELICAHGNDSRNLRRESEINADHLKVTEAFSISEECNYTVAKLIRKNDSAIQPYVSSEITRITGLSNLQDSEQISDSNLETVIPMRITEQHFNDNSQISSPKRPMRLRNKPNWRVNSCDNSSSKEMSLKSLDSKTDTKASTTTFKSKSYFLVHPTRSKSLTTARSPDSTKSTTFTIEKNSEYQTENKSSPRIPPRMHSSNDTSLTWESARGSSSSYYFV